MKFSLQSLLIAMLASTVLVIHAYENEQIEEPSTKPHIEQRMVKDAFDGATTFEEVLRDPSNKQEARANWKILTSVWHGDQNPTMKKYATAVYSALNNAYKAFIDPRNESFHTEDLDRIYDVDINKFHANKRIIAEKFGGGFNYVLEDLAVKTQYQPSSTSFMSEPERQQEEREQKEQEEWVIVEPEPQLMPEEDWVEV